MRDVAAQVGARGNGWPTLLIDTRTTASAKGEAWAPRTMTALCHRARTLALGRVPAKRSSAA